MISINPFQSLLPQISCDGAKFDGTNDYMTRGAGLTGAADSKTGIFSTWWKFDAASGQEVLLAGARFSISRDNTNWVYISGANAAGTNILQMTSAGSYGNGWKHILASWDLSAATGRIYISDALDFNLLTATNDNIDYTVADWVIGAYTDGTLKQNGCQAETYFAPGQYLDFSIEANRRKFISKAGKPVDLGADGSLPTGTAPLVYLHLAKSEAVANFATNRGTGGNFSITGILDTATTRPSD